MESDRAILCCLANYSGISIHALQAKSDQHANWLVHRIRISVHALQAESDLILIHQNRTDRIISIHALQAESDVVAGTGTGFTGWFQSTLSKRRATLSNDSPWWSGTLDFNPHSPSGERPDCWFRNVKRANRIFQSTLSKRRATIKIKRWVKLLVNFNPRSPSGERLMSVCVLVFHHKFQSTLSKRRATFTTHR